MWRLGPGLPRDPVHQTEVVATDYCFEGAALGSGVVLRISALARLRITPR